MDTLTTWVMKDIEDTIFQAILQTFCIDFRWLCYLRTLIKLGKRKPFDSFNSFGDKIFLPMEYASALECCIILEIGYVKEISLVNKNFHSFFNRFATQALAHFNHLSLLSKNPLHMIHFYYPHFKLVKKTFPLHERIRYMTPAILKMFQEECPILNTLIFHCGEAIWDIPDSPKRQWACTDTGLCSCLFSRAASRPYFFWEIELQDEHKNLNIFTNGIWSEKWNGT